MKRIATVLLLCLAPALPAKAQSAHELLTNGIEAYRSLDYTLAADLFHRALETAGTGALAPGQRAGAWVYLGAAQSFLGRTADARVSFRRALQADPRHRPDPLIFPPEIAAIFDEVRSRSHFVRVVASPDTVIQLGQHRYRLQLVASSPHELTADLRTEEGRVIRRLYDGAIADTLEIFWDGFDSAGRLPGTGRLILNVQSDGPDPSTVRVPLTATPLYTDSIDHPPPPPVDNTSASEPRPLWPAIGSLAGGLVAGTFAIALPELVSRDDRGGAGRYIVGGTLSLAGLLSFLAQRESRDDGRQQAQVNARNAWRAQLDRAIRENERRRASARLRITTGAPLTGGREDE